MEHLRASLPVLPDESLATLIDDPDHGISAKDARTLVSLDDGERLEFYYETLDYLRSELDEGSDAWKKASKLVANW